MAYSPGGSGGIASVEPWLATGTKGYTQPVEKATMREARKLSATSAGTWPFIAQVRLWLPLAPNLRPAMNTTFFARGSASTAARRSEEHTSELQSLMRISYAVFCLKKKK